MTIRTSRPSGIGAQTCDDGGAMTTYTWIPSPLGDLLATADDGAVTRLLTPGNDAQPEVGWVADDAPFTELRDQLDEYFAGQRTTFDVRLAPAGTQFQQDVWTALRTIPYGRTASYKDVADQIGRPKAVRAVGMANGRNPIGIVVPCHRVIGADGTLVGYAGGLAAKRALLDLEAGVAPLV